MTTVRRQRMRQRRFLRSAWRRRRARAPRAACYVRVGPPAPIVETRVVAPGPGYVWIPGYHRWSGSAYVWVPGRWDRPPRARAVWVPGGGYTTDAVGISRVGVTCSR